MGYDVAMEKESHTSECSRCKLLEAKIVSLEAMAESLAKTVKELTKLLEDVTRSKKRQAAPFRKSNSQKKPKDLHRRTGRLPGHAVASPRISPYFK